MAGSTKVFDAFVTITAAQIELDPDVSDASLQSYLERAGIGIERMRGLVIKSAREIRK